MSDDLSTINIYDRSTIPNELTGQGQGHVDL